MRMCCWIAIASVCTTGVPTTHAKDLISKETQKAINAGLKYLANEQAKDGSWGTNAQSPRVAYTSLTGIAFLAGKHHPEHGQHCDAVAKAIQFVLMKESKDKPGYFMDSGHGAMYSHGFAMQFLAEAHHTIAHKKQKAAIKEALTRAAKLLVDGQILKVVGATLPSQETPTFQSLPVRPLPFARRVTLVSRCRI